MATYCSFFEDNQPALRSYQATPSSAWEVFRKLRAAVSFQRDYPEITISIAKDGSTVGLFSQQYSTPLSSKVHRSSHVNRESTSTEQTQNDSDGHTSITTPFYRCMCNLAVTLSESLWLKGGRVGAVSMAAVAVAMAARAPRKVLGTAVRRAGSFAFETLLPVQN